MRRSSPNYNFFEFPWNSSVLLCRVIFHPRDDRHNKFFFKKKNNLPFLLFDVQTVGGERVVVEKP